MERHPEDKREVESKKVERGLGETVLLTNSSITILPRIPSIAL